MDDMHTLLAILTDINEDVDFASETALVDHGLIDSLDINLIIAAIAEAFQVRITPADIEPEHFNSAEGLLQLIRRHKAET